MLTFPAYIFDIAHSSTEETWRTRMQHEQGGRWADFAGALPIRTLRLRHDMLVDTITRLTSLYNRIGSDDFTSDCLSDIVRETRS